MPRITELKDSRTRTTEQGKINVVRQFVVEFFTGETRTQKNADTVLNTFGYTFGSAADYSHEPGAPAPTDTTVTLQSRVVTREPEAARLFNARLTYKTFDDNPTSKAINNEEIEVDFTTEGRTEYYGDATAVTGDFDDPIDGEKGQFGVSKLVPKMIIRVKRIQSTINYAAIALAAGRVNDAPYTTPGGQLLSAVVGDLLFLGANTRQLDDGKFELNYTFMRDITPVNTDGGVESNKHRVWVARFETDTKKIDSVDPFFIYEDADFTNLMSDE